MGPRPPGREYYWQLLLYAKMLKETENEETRLFCHIFIIGGISIGGDPDHLSPCGGSHRGIGLSGVVSPNYVKIFLRQISTNKKNYRPSLSRSKN